MLRNRRKLKRLQKALASLSIAWNFFMIINNDVLNKLTKVNRRWWVKPVHFQENCGHYQN